MKRIWQKQKLVLIIFTAVLISVFFIGKSVPVAYGVLAGRGLIYSPEGYFIADNGVFGGPGNHTANYKPGSEYISADYHPEAGCTNCIGGYWTKYNKYCCDENGCWVCGHYYLWTCTRNRTGIMGTFTEASACNAAFGQSTPMRAGFFKDISTQVNICEFDTSNAYIIECVAPPVSTPTLPPAVTPPVCAELKDGLCIKVNTSIFQGGDKDKGGISTEPAQFIVRILTIILSFAGGIAFLLILSAGYKIMTSKGKPEAIQQGRDQLISAIVGLVFIIFSFVIFQLVVVDIFKIPGIN